MQNNQPTKADILKAIHDLARKFDIWFDRIEKRFDSIEKHFDSVEAKLMRYS